MKRNGLRWIALTLALALFAALVPVPPAAETALAASKTYGRITANGVYLRKQPSKSADYWFQLDMGFVCEITDTTGAEGINWYKVSSQHPDKDNGNTYVGYIHGDFMTVLTDDEANTWEANPVQVSWTTSGTTVSGATTAPSVVTAAPSTSTDAVGVGSITNGGVNFRETEGGKVIQKFDRGVVVELLSIPSVINSANWYRVRYNGIIGYIQAPYILVTQLYGGTATAAPATDTPVPGTVTATPAAATAAPTSATGSYVKLILSSANLRSAPGGAIKAQWETTGEVLPIAGAAGTKSGWTYYPIVFKNETLYVRSDCVQVVTSGAGSVTAAPSVPTTAPTALTAVSYVKTTKANVNMRATANGKTVKQVAKGVILPVLASPVSAGGYTWYYVQEGSTLGYLRGDCVEVCAADGGSASATATPVPAATATPDPSAATATPVPGSASGYTYIKLTQDKVNLRAKPAGSRVELLAINTVLALTGEAIKSGNYLWYPVKSVAGNAGYVRGDCAVVCDVNGTIAGSTATATPSSGGTTTSAYGYVKITLSKVNFRSSVGGTKIDTLDANYVWPMTGNTTTSGGYTWYPISVNGKSGYVRGDCCFKLSAAQEAAYLASGTIPSTPDSSATSAPSTAATNYVITTMDKVNLRASASKDASAPYNVAQGTVMAYTSTSTVGGSLWYRVVYSNSEVWVLGSCVRIMTQSEYDAYAGTTTTTPQPSVVAGYVRTTANGINVRTEANGSKIIGRVDKGVILPYSVAPVTVRNYQWYYVKTSFGYGYIRGDYTEECQSDGSDVPTASPNPNATATPSATSSTSGQEASYKTLKLGSSGTAVKALVAELKNQGYYTGSVTSSYSSAVQTAVKAFQKAKGLTVDGIAGAATQHALFGTVPIGASDASNLTMAIYPAEKIDWYTGGIQSLWAKGANYKVYDVKTGVVWWAHRWSGGNHVDAEPLTAADTARLCKTYGVTTAQEIADKNLWQRRPLLVTIGTRTFACSLYGVPHNYPEGDTISTNDYKGQLCIHFTNSKTHNSNKVDSYHEEAIQYAWEHAPNGHK